MTSPVYLELVDFIAASNPEGLIHFELSVAAQARLADLINRRSNGLLTAEELVELEQSDEVEHILLAAKAKARALLEQKSQLPRSPLRSRSLGFQPILIEGEPFSQTIIEGR